MHLQDLTHTDGRLPILLSLDGGGVKALSQLVFLERIMRQIRIGELEDFPPQDYHSAFLEAENPRKMYPCDYFVSVPLLLIPVSHLVRSRI